MIAATWVLYRDALTETGRAFSRSTMVWLLPVAILAVLQIAGALQLFLQRDEVDGVVALVEIHHPVKDPAMGIAKEVLRINDLRREVERVIVDKDGAED